MILDNCNRVINQWKASFFLDNQWATSGFFLCFVPVHPGLASSSKSVHKCELIVEASTVLLLVSTDTSMVRGIWILTWHFWWHRLLNSFSINSWFLHAIFMINTEEICVITACL